MYLLHAIHISMTWIVVEVTKCNKMYQVFHCSTVLQAGDKAERRPGDKTPTLVCETHNALNPASRTEGYITGDNEQVPASHLLESPLMPLPHLPEAI